MTVRFDVVRKLLTVEFDDVNVPDVIDPVFVIDPIFMKFPMFERPFVKMGPLTSILDVAI